VLIIALFLVLGSSLFLISLIKLRGFIAQILALYLIVFCLIAVPLHLTNFFSMMNQPWIILSMHLFTFLALGFFWLKRGKPAIISTWKLMWLAIKKEIRYQNKLSSLYLPILLAAVALIYLYHAFLILYVPPNNVDSVSTHMSRVGFWLQFGSYFPWETPKTMQIIYPVNAQLQMFWSVLFTQSDRFVGFVQWLAAVFSAIAVVGLARLYGANRKQALFSGLVFLSLPAIVLQSTTTQNDLAICVLFILLVYFFFNFIKTRQYTSLIFSGMALGLAVGTKQTMLFLLLPLIILVLYTWLIQKMISLRQILIWGSSSLIVFLLIGSQIFFSNLLKFQHPLGPKENVAYSSNLLSASNMPQLILLNSTRLLYQMADTAGLPQPLWGYGIKAKAEISRGLFNLLNIPIESDLGVTQGHHFNLRTPYPLQEDAAWYGPLGFWLLIPGLLFSVFLAIKKKQEFPLIVFLFSIFFLLFDTLFRPGWDPFQGRYFMPIVALASPLAAFWIRDNSHHWIGWLSSAIAVSVMVSVVIINPAKPASGDQAIWQLSRNHLIGLQNRYMIESIDLFEENVPLDATVGIVSKYGIYAEYYFFGPSFTRKLIPLYPADTITNKKNLIDQQIDYVLLFTRKDFSIPDLSYLEQIAETDRIQIYRVEP
jgi:4-amino-4-deoxy-L-arabinose transferase-like glycosyltransferase